MSRTELYRLGRDPGKIGAVSNSWRGGMYVWNDIAKRFFGLESFPMFNEALRGQIWNAEKHRPLKRHEVIVLRSTMDNATAKGDDASVLIEAFRTYGAEHPASSYTEQADLLSAQDLRAGDIVAWRQTSVSEFWGHEGEDEETGEARWYDPATGTKHWNILDFGEETAPKEIVVEPDPMTVTIKLRWDGGDLMLGRVSAGHFSNSPGGKFSATAYIHDLESDLEDGRHYFVEEFDTEAEARSALLSAVRAALQGDAA